MKQKIVLRVQMQDAKKRSKALKLAVGLAGVLSAGIEGADKNQIVVVGEGVDSVALTVLLRKHMGHAELISVSSSSSTEKTKLEADQKKKGEKDQSTAAMASTAAMWPSYGGGYPVQVQPQYYATSEAPQQYYPQDPSCCIM